MSSKLIILSLFICCIYPLNINAQTLTGKIIDDEDSSPIPYATVYIEGTTIGTTTNTNGEFKLQFKMPPQQIVISHVSYQLKSYKLDELQTPGVLIKLTPKKNEIEEIKVSDKNLREKNLNLFRNNFLGTDSWGLKAKIENEDALFFYNEYDSITITAPKNTATADDINLHQAMQMEKDSNRISFLTKSRLKAQTTEPLIVVLPTLGYKIHVDLIEFVYEYSFRGKCYYKGSFFFSELPATNRRQAEKFTKNRLTVYYNSDLHFLRSLYSKNLNKNGYITFRSEQKENGNQKLKAINLTDFCFPGNKQTINLVGLNGAQIDIQYYQKGGKPKDLSQSKGLFPIYSELFIQSDTCVIRSDGTTYDYALSFTSVIGEKKVGAFLPSDYQP